MADAGFFKGTSADQDSRFANKQKKLLKQMKFPENVTVKVDMSKVNLDVIKPWITKRLHELLGLEDDVVIEFVFNQLDEKHPDPKMMQINLTGFLGGSKARLFIGELWNFLASAQTSPDGMPAELVELKKQELLKRQQEDDRLREIRKCEEDTYRAQIKLEPDKSNGRHGRYENSHVSDHKSRNNHERDRRVSPKPVEPRQTKSPVKPANNVSKRHRNNDQRQSPPPKQSRRKPSPVPEKTSSSKSKKSRKQSKRTRSSSSASSRSVSKEDRKQKTREPSVIISSSSSRSRSPVAHRKKKSTDHKSKKHSTNNSKSGKKHDQQRRRSRDRKRPAHRNRSSSRTSDHHEPVPPVEPKKPRLQSEIKVQTPPRSSRAAREDTGSDPPIEKSRKEIPTSTISNTHRTERIVVLEDIEPVPGVTRGSANDSSEDENEIDLRERLLREKAIKSMQHRRQLSQQDELLTSSNDRIVFQT